MAMTQTQWEKRLKALLPSWFFTEENYNQAVISGFAAIFRAIEEDTDTHVLDSMIETSTDGYLDAHGDERQVVRLTDEKDAQYQIRVRNIQSQSDVKSLKAIVDQFLLQGESRVVEDYNLSLFLDADAYLDRGLMLIEDAENCFSIVVEHQVQDAVAFMDDGFFMDVDFFGSDDESSEYVFNLIMEAVNTNKAEGCHYRIIEKVG